ncbi:MAG: pyridoxamine kinase [Lachnospiraceae bacterium]|nr:pyridoxamine kinase [Lachnospiraceae bacterium]
MEYRKILTVQDISCVGQCSLTVALPILSAAGIETAILPSAVLSTHTAGFTGFTCRDLTEDMPAIMDHWKKEGITFDAIYTGYLGSARQIELVKKMFKELKGKDFVSIVDPAMADNGKLYPAFDQAFVDEMKTLAFEADIILPNITEACCLTDMEYKENYDEAYIDELLKKLRALGAKTIILTGVGYDEKTTGVMVDEPENRQYYKHRRIAKGSHGTGDVYASAFVGAYMRGKTSYQAASIAAEYTVRCIENTVDDESHWYGVKFEPILPYYIEALND